MTAYETVSAGSKGAANLLEHKGTASYLGSWLSAQSVKSFTIGPYKLLMKKVMEVIIHRIYFSHNTAFQWFSGDHNIA